MYCKDCGIKIENDSKFCKQCGTIQGPKDNELKDSKEEGKDGKIKEVKQPEVKESDTIKDFDDYVKRLELEIKTDRNNVEAAENEQHSNLTIDIGSKLTDISQKMSSMFSSGINALIKEFEESINKEIKPFENSLDDELKQFEDSINKEINEKNSELEKREKELIEEKEIMILEKQEFLSNLWSYRTKKIKEEKDLHKSLEIKQKDLQKRVQELDQKKAKLEQKNKELEQKEMDLNQELEQRNQAFDEKDKILDSRQKEFETRQKEIEEKEKSLNQELEQKNKEFDEKDKILDSRQKGFESRQKEIEEKEKSLNQERSNFEELVKNQKESNELQAVIPIIIYILMLFSLLIFGPNYLYTFVIIIFGVIAWFIVRFKDKIIGVKKEGG